MIGTDNNILVRAYLEYDKEQADEAKDFLLKTTKEKSLFISSYAIIEFAWVLKTKSYSRKEIYEAVIILMDSIGVIIGQKDVVLAALEKYIKGKADFGDYMILAEGEKNKIYKLKTFDKAIQKEL
jgi:predicted nucleic-acid-binding protein